MTTTNKALSQPAYDAPNWDAPLNANFGIIDNALGGVTSINITGIGSGPVVLTSTQYQKLIISFTGTLTANVTYVVPAGVGGQWLISRATAGNFSIKIASAGAGLYQLVFAGANSVFSDGSNIYTTNPIKPGTISDWYGSAASVPGGWGLCDGTTYTLTDGSGTIVSPNLANKFVIGATGTYAPGTTGGSTTIAQANLPAGFLVGSQIGLSGGELLSNVGSDGSYGYTVADAAPDRFVNVLLTASTQMTVNLGGSGTAYLPPYYALCKIMKI